MAEVIFTPEELQAIAEQVAQRSDLAAQASQILDYLKQLVEQDQQEP